MRCVPVLLLLVPAVIVNAAAPPPVNAPRRDVNGDPLPEGAVARLGTTRFQPHDTIADNPKGFQMYSPSTIALSPDGTTMAAATNSDRACPRIVFMDTSTGKITRKLEFKDLRSARWMQFTPDGKSLVLSGWAGIQVLDAKSGKVTLAYGTNPGFDHSFAMSRDGKWVAYQPQEHVENAPVWVRETKTGQGVMSLPGLGASCKGLAFSPDAKRLLLWSLVPSEVKPHIMNFGDKEALACIDLPTRKIIGKRTIKSMIQSTRFVALCPDGETVAIENADHQSVSIHHLPTDTIRCSIAVKSSGFSFTPDGKALLTIDELGSPALWDTAKGAKTRDFEGRVGHKQFVISGFSRDGRTVAVLHHGFWESAARVIVWNVATGKRVGRPAGHDGAVTCVAYTPDGKMLISGSIDKTVRLWDAASGKHLRLLSVHKEAITAIAISPDGKLVASSTAVAISPDGIPVKSSGLTRLSSIADGKTVAEFAGPERGATALSFSQDGKRLFIGGESSEMVAHEVASGKEVMRLKTSVNGVVMGFGNGGALAVTMNGWLLQLWDLTRQRPAASLTLKNPPVKGEKRQEHLTCDAAAFSPDGRLLATSQVSLFQLAPNPAYFGAPQLRLWERISGEPIQTLGPVITRLLAFSPNGRLLASTGAGETAGFNIGYGSGLDLWDILTGEKAGTLPVTPKSVDFSPDGTRMATGGRDHCVLIWEALKVKQRTLAKAPSLAERDAWWAALGSDAPAAYKVIGQLVDAPEHALPLFKERVHPVPIEYARTVAKLIAQLGSEAFAKREKAERVLEEMREDATPFLKRAIQGNVDLEVRHRVERLLKKSEEISTNYKRHHRAVLTLEWIGTPAARALLRTLADGAPSARLTVEARAALKQLER